MGKTLMLKKPDLPLMLCLVLCIAVSLLTCSTTTTTQEKALGGAEKPLITKTEVVSADQETIVKVICTKTASYTAFQLTNPARIVVDINGERGPALSSTTEIHKDQIEQIQFQPGENQAFSTRMILVLQRPLEYEVEAVDDAIQIRLKNKPAGAAAGQAQETTPTSSEGDATAASTAKPRIFFQPKAIDLNQVLGIDFTMLEQGKSRLIITTDKKCTYDLRQQKAKTLLLKLNKATIPDLLKRHLDSRHFEGVVDQVKASFLPAEKQVAVAITLREMVPFHVNQDDRTIDIEFARTDVKPLEQKIVPLQVAEIRSQPGLGTILEEKPLSSSQDEMLSKVETPGSSAAIGSKTEAAPGEPGADVIIEQPQQPIPGLKRRYRGEPMTMDFVNADVTNILKLISEVSNLNIVWGTEVQGTVSMRLKNVPWDQALDLVLANNNLAKREQGNVIWITTAAKMAQYEADERKRKEEYDAEVKRRFEAQKKQEELEPLVTGYLPLDFASTKDITPHLEALKTVRGKISADERTNTLIVTDVAGTIQKAKQLIKQFDVPVKQIMIEARIVDAGDTFTRKLGIQWTNQTMASRFNRMSGGTYTVPPSAYASGGTGGTGVENPLDMGNQYAGSGTLATNVPAGWTSNMGFTLAHLTSSGLGAYTLDARLALSEAQGLSKTISAPKVIAREGTEAVIKRGDVIVKEKTVGDKIEFKEIEALLSLYVTPVKVSYNDFITLKVRITDDKPKGSDLTKKSIETNLMVKSGDTVVLGGIYQENNSQGEEGIPFLRNIPFLGWLFKARYKYTEKTELMIFITPSVVAAVNG